MSDLTEAPGALGTLARRCQTYDGIIRMALDVREGRDNLIRRAYSEGHKLETIARATGLSKQRISQIVKDGEE